MKGLKTTLVMTGLLLSTVAFADNDALKYQKLTGLAKIKISEAITKAQTEVVGTAVNAELESKLGTVVYEIDVLANNSMYEVFIDAVSGNVLKVRQDID